MREEWRPVIGYEGLYEVSNMGRVKSLKRTVWDNRGYYRTVPERILKPVDKGMGYLYVLLWKDGKGKNCRINRLVAIAFIPNPYNLPEVNHIDQNKENNCVSNLEFCSSKYNCNFGDRNKRIAEKLTGRKQSKEHVKRHAEKLRGKKQSKESVRKRAEKLTNHPKTSKPVIAIDKITGLILEYPSLHEASRQLRINLGNISNCLNGRQKTCGGFYWYYADTTE